MFWKKKFWRRPLEEGDGQAEGSTSFSVIGPESLTGCQEIRLGLHGMFLCVRDPGVTGCGCDVLLCRVAFAGRRQLGRAIPPPSWE